MILDTHVYHNSIFIDNNVNPNNYITSDVRNWLTTDFIDTAFMFGNNKLVNKSVDNNTQDKIYLPSYDEVVDLTNKTSITSDYSRAAGVWSNKDNYCGSYWTRSASSNFYYCAWNVNSGGVLSEYSVMSNGYSIRPSITVNI